jgi:hypothetical protein
MSTARDGDDIYYRSMAFNLFAVTRPDLNVPPGGFTYPHTDATAYFVEANGLNHQPPFVWRVVTPLLARALSILLGNIDRAFYLITFLSLFGAAFLLAMVLYEGLGTIVPSVVALGVFPAGHWLSAEYFFHYMYVDPLSIFFTCAGAYAVVRRKRAMFFVLCAVSVFNRESGMFLIAAYPLSEWFLERRVHRSSLISAAAIVLAWFLFQAVVRSLVPVDTYSPLALIRIGFQQGLVGPLQGALYGLLLAAGALFIPAWRGVASPMSLSLSVSLVPSVVGSMQAGGSSPRYFGQAVPILVVMMFSLWPDKGVDRVLILVPAVLFAFMPLLVHGDGWTLNWTGMKLTLGIVACAEAMLFLRLRSRIRWGWAAPSAPRP